MRKTIAISLALLLCLTSCMSTSDPGALCGVYETTDENGLTYTYAFASGGTVGYTCEYGGTVIDAWYGNFEELDGYLGITLPDGYTFVLDFAKSGKTVDIDSILLKRKASRCSAVTRAEILKGVWEYGSQDGYFSLGIASGGDYAVVMGTECVSFYRYGADSQGNMQLSYGCKYAVINGKLFIYGQSDVFKSDFAVFTRQSSAGEDITSRDVLVYPGYNPWHLVDRGSGNTNYDYTFKSDGTYSLYETYDGGSFSESGTFTLSGHTIKLSINGGGTAAMAFSIIDGRPFMFSE